MVSAAHNFRGHRLSALTIMRRVENQRTPIRLKLPFCPTVDPTALKSPALKVPYRGADDINIGFDFCNENKPETPKD